MNVIGERITVLTASDPSKRGRSGVVVLESMNTLVIDSGNKKIRVEKDGTAFQVSSSRRIITGADISGRLEDRWGTKSK
jgi:RNase P/RNase MRP subunit p29